MDMEQDLNIKESIDEAQKVTATWKKGALTWANGGMKRVSSGPKWRDKAPSEKEVKKHLEKILKKGIILDYKVVGK